jgi:hypothetical protein
MLYDYKTKKETHYKLWVEKTGIVLMHESGASFSADYSKLGDMRQVPKKYYDIMMMFLLYRMDELIQPIEPINVNGNKTILTYSGGADSTAIVNNFNCIPIHLHRNSSNDYDLTQEIAVKEVGGYIIPNDMENIRILYENKFGFKTYSGLIIPAMYILGADTIIEGAIFDDVAFNYGKQFKYNAEANVSQRKLDHEKLGIKYRYPLAGYSELLTTFMADQSNIKYSSCHHVEKSPCRTCYKCFRKLGFKGIQLKDLSKIEKIFKKFPLKMASSTIYAIQEAGYSGEIFDRFKYIDVSFCERVNKLMQQKYYDEEYILDGFEWQTEEDEQRIKNFVNVINDKKLYK